MTSPFSAMLSLALASVAVAGEKAGLPNLLPFNRAERADAPTGSEKGAPEAAWSADEWFKKWFSGRAGMVPAREDPLECGGIPAFPGSPSCNGATNVDRT